ncbi:hypothetical protein B0I18_10737 [Taibaiella chishuiensis]|uniref:Uncharacterized protein n=2 Tax=Taibaiella chishuiensis TaxID=1434707 RepID=A0A2P8D096_9BACT|nr:hypothetical protein B0I18_10737 [Taibaiella chishuiensis]
MDSLAPETRRVIDLIILLHTAGVLVAYCFYLKSVTGLLQFISPVNRTIRPAMVWLLLLGFVPYFTNLFGTFMYVPFILRSKITYLFFCFAIILQFFIVGRVAIAISAEYRSRRLPTRFAPTFKRGILYCLANLVQLLMLLLHQGRELTIAAWCLVMVTWIVYWVGVARYKKAISHLPVGSDPDSIFFAGNA